MEYSWLIGSGGELFGCIVGFPLFPAQYTLHLYIREKKLQIISISSGSFCVYVELFGYVVVFFGRIYFGDV